MGGGAKKNKIGINIFSKKGFLSGGHNVAKGGHNVAPPKQKPSYAPGNEKHNGKFMQSRNLSLHSEKAFYICELTVKTHSQLSSSRQQMEYRVRVY